MHFNRCQCLKKYFGIQTPQTIFISVFTSKKSGQTKIWILDKSSFGIFGFQIFTLDFNLTKIDTQAFVLNEFRSKLFSYHYKTYLAKRVCQLRGCAARNNSTLDMYYLWYRGLFYHCSCDPFSIRNFFHF